jgi:truncated hemoglobin YjbI
MNTVINNTVFNVVANPVLTPFFNGVSGPVDYLTNATARAQLTQGLVEFFGDVFALNCTDGTVLPYTGPGMVDAHDSMAISRPVFTNFNDEVIQTGGELGVVDADLDRILIILNTQRAQICNSGAECATPSLCDKYSILLFLTNEQLLTVIVNETVIDVVGSSLLRFFDGSIRPPSFVDPANAALLATLELHLVQFFAQANILGCTDNSIGGYQGNPDMKAVHAPFPIFLADFNLFNNLLVAVLARKGVDAADQATVLTVLESTKGDICNQADCGNGSQANLFVSFFLLLSAFLVALF